MRAGFLSAIHSTGVIIYAPTLGDEVAQVAVDLDSLRWLMGRSTTELLRILPCWSGTAQDDGRPVVPFWCRDHDRLALRLVGIVDYRDERHLAVYATPTAT